MTTQDKIEKLKEFENEKNLREFLIDLLKKLGFTNVFHTHRYGNPEQGKDIIGKYPHPLEGDDWYAFVVKHGRIGGGTVEIETIKGQIKQSFEYPYAGLSGEEIKVNKVKVVTNEYFTSGAQGQISSSPELRVYNNFGFWWNETLIPQIDSKYSDFWLPGDAFAKEYSKNFKNKIASEVEIRELSNRKIDDKQLQRLINIFVEPQLTQTYVEDDKGKKSIKRKKISISSLKTINEDILLSGEQGAGKTKVLNSLALQLSEINFISDNKIIPVKLKAPQIRNGKYDIKSLVANNVKFIGGDFFNDKTLSEYKVVLLVDDMDLLNSNEKSEVVACIKAYCDENKTHYIITYRKDELSYTPQIKNIKIHNFNNKQIELFIAKFFEGTGRGERFIEVLKNSNILSKLPTTPLTITLISLLYDENNFEIPATLSDIYNDFVDALLGKLEIRNRAELLLFNIKRRLFSSLALKMLDEKKFEIRFDDFGNFINSFLENRGYNSQTIDELNDLIDNSNLLYKDEREIVGFKQQAFVEFLASLEIYHHVRESHYQKLIHNFNDINWQNTAVFYAGHSKELVGMIDDVVNNAPNTSINDRLIVTGGMGYLSQALYQTPPVEREKLVLRALELLITSFYEMKDLTKEENNPFYGLPLPLLGDIVIFWFNENFKSITLKTTLEMSFNDLEKIINENEFENDFKLLMIASTLMNPFIGNEEYFEKLIERPSFIRHHLLPLIAEILIEMKTTYGKGLTKETKEKVVQSIRKKQKYISSVLKEPAYRFNSEGFGLEVGGSSVELASDEDVLTPIEP